MKQYLSVFATVMFISCFDCSEVIGKDGFNYFKDYARGRSDEIFSNIPTTADRILYVYRTPLQLYPGLLPTVLDQEYRKRTGNAFKNHMLSKDLWVGAEPPGKRSSKTALSLMLGNKHDTFERYVGCPYAWLAWDEENTTTEQ